MALTNNGIWAPAERNVPYQEAFKLLEARATLEQVAPLWPSSAGMLKRIREAINTLIADYHIAGDALEAERRNRGMTDRENAAKALEQGWHRGAFDDDCSAIALAPTERDVMQMVTMIMHENGIEVGDGDTLENLLARVEASPIAHKPPFLAGLLQAAISRMEEIA